MNVIESKERFCDCMKAAIDRVRQLEKCTHNRMWNNIANSLEQLLKRGEEIMQKRSIPRQEMLDSLDRYKVDLANHIHPEEENKQKVMH